MESAIVANNDIIAKIWHVTAKVSNSGIVIDTIAAMADIVSGIRDTSHVLGISQDKVMSTLKKQKTR